jgi:hypothetical protein
MNTECQAVVTGTTVAESFLHLTTVQMASIITNILSKYSQGVHEFFSSPEKYSITYYNNSK